MMNEMKKNELNETEMEKVAGGRRTPGPLDILKQTASEREKLNCNAIGNSNAN